MKNHSKESVKSLDRIIEYLESGKLQTLDGVLDLHEMVPKKLRNKAFDCNPPDMKKFKGPYKKNASPFPLSNKFTDMTKMIIENYQRHCDNYYFIVNAQKVFMSYRYTALEFGKVVKVKDIETK